MNLLQFLDQVDMIAMNQSQEELAALIHDLARTLPENQRENFLKKLCAISGEILADKEGVFGEIQMRKELERKTSEIQKKLELVEAGEICLVGNLNEQYDEWYSDDSEEFIFEDPERVLEMIKNICDLVHQCVDCEAYQEGDELAGRLLELVVMVEGDYSEYGDAVFSVKQISDEGLGDLNYRQLILDALYSAYKVTPMEERPEVIYDIICNSGCHDISLETLIQIDSEELDRWKEFLDLWTDYLGTQTGAKAEKFLAEAVAWKNDSEQLLELARKFFGLHPGIYEQILRTNSTGVPNGKQLEVGREALQAIQPQYIVRSRIALLTAEYALRLEKQEEAERCWLEAFRSDTRPIHYLRLLAESHDFSVYQDEVRMIYQAFAETAKRNPFSQSWVGELSKNEIDRNTYYALAFFDGDFQQVLGEGMNEKGGLGWSSTFMKCGIALFLLYLYEKEECSVGCRSMCDRVVSSILFTAKNYSQGMLTPVKKDDDSLFWDYFCKWKMMTPMSEAEKQQVLKKLEVWIQTRVDGIMQGNHRKYYGECAALIAALGEVKESRGEAYGKANQMEAYRAAYSRRSAFAEELRAFGMNDSRKKK